MYVIKTCISDQETHHSENYQKYQLFTESLSQIVKILNNTVSVIHAIV